MKPAPEMSPEEFERWLSQNGDSLQSEAGRHAQNFLARHEALKAAASAVHSKQDPSHDDKNTPKKG